MYNGQYAFCTHVHEHINITYKFGGKGGINQANAYNFKFIPRKIP